MSHRGAKASAGKRARALRRKPKCNRRIIAARSGGVALSRRRWLDRLDYGFFDEPACWVRRFGAGQGKAQLRLFAECERPEPSKKVVIRALMKGATFHAVARGREGSSTASMPLFLLSAVHGGREKKWLWDMMEADGVDIRLVDPRGRGFEVMGIRSGGTGALEWWEERGGGIDRLDADGRGIWSRAAESGPKAIEALERIWPGRGSSGVISDAIYGLQKVFERRDEKTMAHSGYARHAKGSAYVMLAVGPKLTRLAEWMVSRPDLARPSLALSSFFEDMCVDESALSELRKMELRACALSERDQLSASSGEGRPRAQRSL